MRQGSARVRVKWENDSMNLCRRRGSSKARLALYLLLHCDAILANHVWHRPSHHHPFHTPGPLPPQAAAWSAVTVSPTSPFLLADHAGSGKTLAYLLPLVQRLKLEEERAGLAAVTRPNSPRVLVLVPTTGEAPGGCLRTLKGTR